MGVAGSRFLWTGLLAPPLLVLAATGAMTVWPQQVVGVIDGVVGLWSPPPAAVGHRPVPSAMMSGMPTPPPPPMSQFKGTIRKPDGSPFTGKYALATVRSARGGGHSGHFSDSHQGPDFTAHAAADRSWIVVDAEGYAPATLGPLEWQPGGSDEPLTADLADGFPHVVRVVDSEGAPIPLAEVHASLTLDHRPASLHDVWITDDDGRVTFPHAKEAEYEFDVKVHGAQIPDDTIFATPRPGGPETPITLDRASNRGVVVDEEGRPVADAVICVAAEFDEQSERVGEHPFSRVVLAKSDAEGRFPLPHLHEHSTYLLRADGLDGSLGYAPGVRVTSPDVRVTLRPRRVVLGIVKGGPKGDRTTTVAVERTVPTGFESGGPMADSRSVIRLVEGVNVGRDGSFEYPAWGSVGTELMIGGRAVPVPWPPPAEPIAFAPAPAPEVGEGSVLIQVTAEASIRPIHGSMTLSLMNAPPEMALQTVRRLVPIEGDRGKFSSVQTEAFRYDSSAIPGYWTVPGTIVASPGGGDRMADVRVYAAGPIRGRVIEGEGSPVGAGLKVTAEFDPGLAAAGPQFPPPGGQPPPPLGMHPTQRPGPANFPGEARVTESAETGADGRFVIPSWPLDAPSQLVASRGRYAQRVDWTRAVAGSREREIVIRLPRTARGEVRVVDPQGRPIPGASIHLMLQRPGDERRFWDGGKTDSEGRVVLDDLAEGEGAYSVEAWFEEGFRYVSAPLKPDGPPVELRAERGRVLEGRAVEAVTGWPVERVQLIVENGSEVVGSQMTDEAGRFRFTALPRGPLKFRSGSLPKLASPQPAEVPDGFEGPLEIRMMDVPRHMPTPKPPARR